MENSTVVLIIVIVIVIAIFTIVKKKNSEGLRLNTSVNVLEHDMRIDDLATATQYKGRDIVSVREAVSSSLNDLIEGRVFGIEEDPQFVNQVFMVVAGRPPNFMEKGYYIDGLATGSLTRNQIINDVLTKDSAIKVRAFNSLYLEFFGRSPKLEEYQLYEDVIFNDLMDIATLSRTLRNEPEAKFRRKIYELFSMYIHRSPTIPEYSYFLYQWQKGLSLPQIENIIQSVGYPNGVDFQSTITTDKMKTMWNMQGKEIETTQENMIIHPRTSTNRIEKIYVTGGYKVPGY